MPLTAEGRALALRSFLGSALTLRLYINDAQPGDELQEAIGFGYRPIPLAPNAWELRESEATYPEQVFGFTGPIGNVYGYYVTDGSGKVIDSKRFPDGPYPCQTDDQIIVTPTAKQR